MDRYAPGHTLVELLVAVAVATVLAMLAVPAFAEWRANASRDERVGRLQRTFALARAEALAGGRPVVVCAADAAAAGGADCAADARWHAGWIAFVDERTPRGRRDAGETLLAMESGRTGVRVASGRRAVEFLPSAVAATTATLVVCDRRGVRAARAVVVSRTGRVRIATSDADGRALDCG